ncbi:MAG: pyridoxal-phosphate-dependent aminotransferase family protein [Chloroflexota bacterium]
MNLRIPGPTPLPPAVVQAMLGKVPGHRSRQFEELLAEVTAQLRQVFATAGEALVLTGSGTGGLEAAVVNLLSPGQPALFVTVGSFGERWAKIAEAFGVAVSRLAFAPGQAADPAAVAERLRAEPDLGALFLTHCETSTGVLNDLPALVEAARRVRPDLVVAVDGVSSVGAAPLETDAWGLDLVVTASQKALMGPPGLAPVAVSPRGWAAVEAARLPRYYWDLRRARRDAAKRQTPFTPAVQDLLGLRAGLGLLLAEGLPASFVRHAELARLARARLGELGFRPLADEAHASPTVTAAWVPGGLDCRALLGRLEAKEVYLTAGHDKSCTLRIAHMGYVRAVEVEAALAALGEAASALRDVAL